MAVADRHPSRRRGLLRRSVEIYRQHFRVFVSITILPQILVFAVLLLRVRMPELWPELVGLKGEGLIVIPGLLGVMALPCFVALAVTASAVADVQLGRVPALGAAYGRLGWKKSRALVNLAGSIVLRGLAFFAFICLPIVFMAVLAPLADGKAGEYTLEAVVLSLVLAAPFVSRYVVAVPVLMLEDVDSPRAVQRGLLLTKGKQLRAVGTGLLLMAIAVAPALLIHFLASLAAAALKVGPHPPWLGWLEVAGGTLAQILVGPLWTIPPALLYYDLKARQESLGPPAAP